MAARHKDCFYPHSPAAARMCLPRLLHLLLLLQARWPLLLMQAALHSGAPVPVCCLGPLLPNTCLRHLQGHPLLPLLHLLLVAQSQPQIEAPPPAADSARGAAPASQTSTTRSRLRKAAGTMRRGQTAIVARERRCAGERVLALHARTAAASASWLRVQRHLPAKEATQRGRLLHIRHAVTRSSSLSRSLFRRTKGAEGCGGGCGGGKRADQPAPITIYLHMHVRLCSMHQDMSAFAVRHSANACESASAYMRVQTLAQTHT